MKNLSLTRIVLAVFLLALPLSGCTCHSTRSTEVGVLTRKVGVFGNAGIQEQVYAPGALYVFPAFITDWTTFDVSIQNLSMVRSSGSGRQREDNDLAFKTIDGNDINVDVTVAWQVNPKRAGHLLATVGETTEQVMEKLVRPACRSVVRDVLNELHSEDFYVSDKRFEKAALARDRLAAVLEPEGILVTQVILGEHRFHKEYEQVIRDKKLAEQDAERLRSEGRAAAEEAKRKLEAAKGQVQQQLAEASGYLDTVKLKSDSVFFENQKQAEALLAERKAQAQAAKKRNEALAGVGGTTLVKLRMAEALAGKQIIFLPSGSGGHLQTLNVNTLLKSVAATAVEQAEQPAQTSEQSSP
ncbi:MAG TPA: SPFH domain-containing protein [Myxococcaceae bacterium]|nr:SPFH domain-containing protein [Myxococcaceae bacterium]